MVIDLYLLPTPSTSLKREHHFQLNTTVRTRRKRNMGTEKWHHWGSWDVGQERKSIKSNRKSVGFPSFPCFWSDIQDYVSLMCLFLSRPPVPCRNEVPSLSLSHTKNPLVLCSHRAQLCENLFHGCSNCQGDSTLQQWVVFKVPISTDMSYKIQLLPWGMADPADGRSSTTVNGVTRDFTTEGQGVWGLHQAGIWFLHLHLGECFWG
jgi:hypothetical protein